MLVSDRYSLSRIKLKRKLLQLLSMDRRPILREVKIAWQTTAELYWIPGSGGGWDDVGLPDTPTHRCHSLRCTGQKIVDAQRRSRFIQSRRKMRSFPESATVRLVFLTGS
jgi:hypothetical protein